MEENERSRSSMELRKKAGLSRMQVAVALGVTESTVAKWEQGKQEPHLPPRRMKILMDLYQCDIEELIELFPQPSEKKTADQPRNIPEDREVPIAS
jgi:transcriptional regulator with XRE-family HTH domain